MAGISQQIAPEEVLPLLGRNVFAQGYEGNRPTEFLLLLRRYVVQARELADLAASNGMVIRVSNCSDAAHLLQILGYRASASCGTPGTVLQTEDSDRAFLAIDSGFPLPELEETLQGGKPFEYRYSASSVPVLFAESDWTRASKTNYRENSKDLLDTILKDRSVARLYWAMSRLDVETARYLQQSVGLEKLLPFAAVLDFYGRTLCIHDGRVKVPGGTAAEPAWKDLVGASPESPASFVLKLVAKDKGWLAAYFDSLSRVSAGQQAYFTDPRRLRLFYDGVRAAGMSVPATRGSFRPAPGLLLLATRLRLDSNGEPLVPGNLQIWRDILLESHDSHFIRKSGKVPALDGPDQLVQIMCALSREDTDSGPLQVYMALSELDARRTAGNRLAPETVHLLARKFVEFSDQYRIFAEFPEINDESIALFLHVAQQLNNVPAAIRGNTFGTFQATVGLWQILARQGQISPQHLNDSWQRVIKPFTSVHTAPQLYDAGRTSLGELFRFSKGTPKGSQDEIIDLLAGPAQTTPEGKQMHREISSRMRSVLDDQRLVSLDTLLTVGDALAEKAHGKPPQEYAMLLASETREFQMPRPIFTNGERTEWAAGIYNNHHTNVEMHNDLPTILKSANASQNQVAEARGQLAAFLRDTLVGLNYAYYEPPGAQALHNNPLLVRSHDFAGDTITGINTLWQAPQLLGQGAPAGGGAHFVGSLADLPYSLAELEQDFIAPRNVQALIWKELTPEILASAILPRWWDVSPMELHAIALYQRSGEELLTASSKDETLRTRVMTILSDRLLPPQAAQLEQALRADRASEAVAQMMPADTFYLAAEFQRKYPAQLGNSGAATQELTELSRLHPEAVSWTRLSHDFGTPHPSVANNYGLELINLAPLPPFSGLPSRFLGESWDSTNLYWARLADEEGLTPVSLNRLVPELTRTMVERIFATDFEDWAALLRAMHEAGQDFRDGNLAMTKRAKAAKP